MALYRRMRQAGLAADVGSLNLALTGLCCRGRLEEAVELLEQEVEDSGGVIKPNSFTVLMILQVCVVGGTSVRHGRNTVCVCVCAGVWELRGKRCCHESSKAMRHASPSSYLHATASQLLLGRQVVRRRCCASKPYSEASPGT